MHQLSKKNITRLTHYTTVQGFDGIITSHSLRMTESNFLNDPSDCRYIITLIENYLVNENRLSDIINEATLSGKTKELCQKEKFSFISYIKYIYDHIYLYITSFSTEDDSMDMWNYYAQNGMALTFEIESLTELFKPIIKFTNDYIINHSVIYVPKAENDSINKNFIDKISVPPFFELQLTQENVFKNYKSCIQSPNTEDLNKTTCLSAYIQAYLNSYLLTLDQQLSNIKDTTHIQPEEIFQNILKTIFEDKENPWKYNITLYMLILSSLIKAETYKHEKEYRFVYLKYHFEYRRKQNYITKSLPFGDILCPYINMLDATENPDIEKHRKNFFKALEKVTISPFAANIPINKEKYKEILENYLLTQKNITTTNVREKSPNKKNVHTDTSTKHNTNIQIEYSKHSIRW